MQILRWTLCFRARNLLIIALLCMLPCASFSQVAVGVSITVAPPPLPVYEQPLCPGPNYMWTPGYWAWGGPDGYYWVPGTWVMAPAVGLLWTPGYWGWGNGGYVWNAGYWGPQVGFYGGIDYGFGYGGVGFYGGRWSGRYFSYNTAVVRVNTTVIHNTYVDRTVIRNVTVNHVSYNGGRGGIQMRPTAAQEAAARQRRFGPVTAQRQQATFARQDKANFASVNHGAPSHAALARPATSVADFKRAVPASGAKPVNVNETRPVNGHPENGHAAPTPRPANETRPATRPESKPTAARPTAESHPAAKPAPARPAAESRPAPRPAAKPAPETRPASETHPTATRPATTARPANETRPGTRPAPAEHTAETRPVPKPAPAVKPAPETRQASRPSKPEPAPAVKPESKPAPVEQAKPEPQPRPESKPAPVQQARPEAQPRPEPQSRPAQSAERPAPAAKPAPEPRPSQSTARPAPQQHESAPRPSGEKEHPSQE